MVGNPAAIATVQEVSIQFPKQVVPGKRPDIKQLNAWRAEAMDASRDWRSESWRDWEMYDGDQWSLEDKSKAKDAGIPYTLTINRTFPTINVLLGLQLMNKYDLSAKGRTNKDAEISQVMTEGMKFVMDQWDGHHKIGMAFRDEIIAGIGFLLPCLSADPRKERVKVTYGNWTEIWWDPYSSPWLDAETCRYVLRQRWMDAEDLCALFPEKRDEIGAVSKEMIGGTYRAGLDDEDTLKEEKVNAADTGWADTGRKRIRPCELWYTAYETCLFGVFPNGNVMEISPDAPPMEQFAIVSSTREVVSATVKKYRVATFLGSLLLADTASPYSHDSFPFVPFVGYLNRWNNPFGVPRQLRDHEEEINRRRSMALALISSRRVMIEEDAASDTQSITQIYEEINKPDGFIILRSGALREQKIRIAEQAQLAPEQLALLAQSEREIMQIAGTNAEVMGYRSNAISNVAEERRAHQSGIVTATLFDNYRRSLNILGTQVMSLIQAEWRGEKVLRITDRMSGADRFVALNQRITDANGALVVRNDITQGKFDVVVSDSPMTDTTREINLMMIIEWIKKSPPEVIPHLLTLAFEMSNVPNKDQLMAKIKPLFGQDPRDEDLSPEEIKQKAVANLEAQAQMQAEQAQLAKAATELELENKRLLNEKIKAEIQKISSMPATEAARVDALHRKVDVSEERVLLDGIRTGADIEGKKRATVKMPKGEGSIARPPWPTMPDALRPPMEVTPQINVQPVYEDAMVPEDTGELPYDQIRRDGF